MGSYALKIVAFFYLISSSQATLLIHPIGGAIAAAAAGKVMFKGALLGAAGLAAAGAIHKHMEDYWKQHLGENTKMPKAITDCLNGTINQQGGAQVDGASLVKFKSYFHPRTSNINININMTKTINGGGSATTGSQSSSQTSTTVSGGQQSTDQTMTSSKSFYGPPRSSATDMANSYGAPISSPTSMEGTISGSQSTQETIASIQDSVTSLFFAEGDLSLGKKMNIHFTRSTNGAPFLPRDMVEKVPFTIAKFPEILSEFNLKADSEEAMIMSETLKYCEDDKGGDKCCTSLESMVDFATSIVGKSVKAISTNIDKDSKMEYKVQGIKKLPCGQQAVTCHKIPFPCAVFYCQKVEKMTVFIATLVGTDGSAINTPAVCHEDTSSWDHGHWVFQNLQAQPGNCPVCHFLLDDDVLWIAKSA